jgi:soluble lytic murein transglycosylase-like protein
MFIMNYAIRLSRELEIFCQTFILHKLQHLIMSRPDRLKRQPTANTTPQSTPSFDPIDPDKEAANQRSEAEQEEITGSVEEKREGRQKSSGGRKPSATQK